MAGRRQVAGAMIEASWGSEPSKFRGLMVGQRAAALAQLAVICVLLGGCQGGPAQETEGWLPIHYAARDGNVSFLQDLKVHLDTEEADCDKVVAELQANTSDSRTTAHIAAEYGQLPFLQWATLFDEGWVNNRHEGPCSDGAKEGLRDIMSQRDGQNRSVAGIALEASLSGREGNFTDVLAFLVQKYDKSVREIEQSGNWSADFAQWYAKWAFKPRDEIVERAHSRGFGPGALLLEKHKQISVHPPIHEINNLLTPEACEGVVHDASLLLTASKVGGTNPVRREKIQKFLEDFDMDNSTVLNKTEMRKAVLTFLNLECGSFADKGGGQQIAATAVAKLLQMDPNEDGEIDLVNEEFNHTLKDMEKFEAGVEKIKRLLKSRQIRTSRQAFLPSYLPSARRVRDSFKAALGMPDWMVDAAEELQVVRYQPGEHYGPHLDGATRRMTIFSYLNDVEEGGQTAFPFAGIPITRDSLENVTMTKECHESFNCCSKLCRAVNSSICNQELMDKKNSSNPMTIQQMRKCLQTVGAETWNLGPAGMQVPAKKGNAVVWYNYDRDTHGHRDELPESHHCGCDIEKGRKWAANLWVHDISPINHALDHVTRVAAARRAGRAAAHPVLLGLGDATFDVWAEPQYRAKRLYELSESIERQLLGIGEGGKRPVMYRQTPDIANVHGAEDFIRAAVLLHESMNNTRSSPVHMLRRMSMFQTRGDDHDFE